MHSTMTLSRPMPTSTPSFSAPNTPSATTIPRPSIPSTPQPPYPPPPTTTAPTPTPTTTLPLPNPSLFDILPPLHELLSRLLASTNQPYKTAEPLEIHHLVAETSSVRNRIRRARREVEALPDVERSVAEQDEEIRVLRERIELQRGVLRGVGGAGL